MAEDGRYRWGWRGVAPVVLAAVVAVTYANALRGALVLDSSVLVAQDVRLRVRSAENLRLILTRDYWWPAYASDLYRPVTTLSFMANYQIARNGTAPLAYHLTNVVLHWLNAWLVFGLLRRHVRGGAGGALGALAGAVLFAVHPVNTEVVTNVVGRADLLVTACVLGVLGLHAARDAGRGPVVATLRLSAMGLLSVIAVLCKENAIVLLPLMALEDWAREGPKNEAPGGFLRRVGWGGYLAVLPGACLLCGIRMWMHQSTVTFAQIAADNPIVLAGWWAARMTALKVIGHYAALIVWPATLSCDYSYRQIPNYGEGTLAEDGLAWAVLAGVVLVLALAWRARRRRMGVTFFITFAAIAFLPTSNLLFNAGTNMAERFMYLPLAGAVGLAALAVACAWEAVGARIVWRGALVTGAVAVAVALGVRSHVRNEDWQTAERLFSSAIGACPNGFRGYKGLAGSIAEHDPRGERLDECIRTAEAGVAILDHWPLPPEHMPSRLLLDLAVYHVRKGDRLAAGAAAMSDAVRNEYVDAVRILDRGMACDRAVNAASRRSRLSRGVPAARVFDVGLPDLYEMAGKVEMRLGDANAAVTAVRYALHLDPARIRNYRLLALAERTAGRIDRAAVAELQALILGEEDPGLVNDLGIDYGRLAPATPAVMVVDGTPRLNAANARLRRDLNSAARDLVRSLVEIQSESEAAQVRDVAVQRFGCDPAGFVDLPGK